MGYIQCATAKVSNSKNEEQNSGLAAYNRIGPLQRKYTYLVPSPPHISQHGWLVILDFQPSNKLICSLEVLPH